MIGVLSEGVSPCLLCCSLVQNMQLLPTDIQPAVEELDSLCADCYEAIGASVALPMSYKQVRYNLAIYRAKKNAVKWHASVLPLLIPED